MAVDGTGFIITVDLPHGARGYVVVDSIISDTSSGGLRIYNDIDLAEVDHLAREMTLKFCFIGLSRGGAKSGIQIPQDLSAVEKLNVCQQFGASLKVIISKGVYYPGMDMNCGPDELKAVYRGAGIELGRITDTSYFTALSVAQALMAYRDYLRTEQPLTLAIEGFGSVGRYLAERLPQDQFRIKAVSTLAGGVISSSWFYNSDLVSARMSHGDNLVSHLTKGRKVSLAEVLAADVDILIPAARVFSIDSENVESLRAQCLVPVANAPCTSAALAALHERDIICLPGFVTNSGGVFASGLYDSGVSRGDIEKIAEKGYRPVINALLDNARKNNEPPSAVAERVAWQRYERKLRGEDCGIEERKLKWLRALERKKMIPTKYYARQFAATFSRNLEDLCRTLQEG